MHNFRELDIWMESKNFAVEIYRLTATFPQKEGFGMISQMNRSVVSIASNISEGAGRNSNKDFSRFISISIGSAFELETQLTIAYELNYLKQEEFERLLDKIIAIEKKLVNFNKYLQK